MAVLHPDPSPATLRLPIADPCSVLSIDARRAPSGDPWLGLVGPLDPSARTCEIWGDDAFHAQLDERFALVIVRVVDQRDEGRRRALMHTAMQHVERDGHLLVLHAPDQLSLCNGFGADLVLVSVSVSVSVPGADGAAATSSYYARGPRFTVHDLLHEARRTIDRITPHQLDAQLRGVEPPTVIDTRTHTDRHRFGVIPGSVHVPRTVLEWHLDPSNGYVHPAITSFEHALVVVCNGGYSSSLAAANLVRLGFTRVADLVGGHEGWRSAGLAVDPADHSHLDVPGGEVDGRPGVRVDGSSPTAPSVG